MLRRTRVVLMMVLTGGIALLVWSPDLSSDPRNRNILSEQPSQMNELLEKQQYLLQTISKYPNLSTEDKQKFLNIKHQEYKERRDRIQQFCTGSKLNTKLQEDKIVYDEADGVSYCMIPKVASSTWCTHFINLGNPPEKVRHRYREALQLLAPKLFPAPAREQLLAGWPLLTSVVVVRHPLSRLASIYQQKFVNLATHKSWGRLNKKIIEKYRSKDEEGKLGDEYNGIPTPEEMVRHVAATLKSGRGVDQHWKPQFESCPFCLLNFTIYARVEELVEDTLVFVLEAGLENRLNISTKMNPTQHNEFRFWSLVSSETISELLEPYRLDFTMFGYSARDYLAQMGVLVNLDLVNL